jgi:glycosyltransferase involved in cell wall biosynthesis
LWGHFKFIWFVISTLIKLRPSVVCAVNEDLAFFLSPFRGIAYGKLVCDIFDPFDDRVSHRGFLIRNLAGIISWGGRRFSDRLIVTDQNRLKRLSEYSERYASKAIVVENVPEDPGDEIAKQLPTGSLKIFVGGTLSQSRGLSPILKAIAKIPDAKIISAGWVYDDAASQFVRHKSVDYRGVVTLRQALQYSNECDAVLAFYEPNSKNNLNASPNKVYDALSVGRPSILNSEIPISNWVVENGFGFSCAYEDQPRLQSILEQLIEKRPSLPDFCSRARKEFLENHSWEKAETQLLAFYRELSND